MRRRRGGGPRERRRAHRPCFARARPPRSPPPPDQESDADEAGTAQPARPFAPRRRRADRRRRASPASAPRATSQGARPAGRFAILEGREAIGGTWDLFRYPGDPLGLRPVHLRVRLQAVESRTSRSPAADLILDYLRETVAENDLDRHIRFGHRVTGAALVVRRGALDGRRSSAPTASVELTCRLPVRGTRLLRLRARASRPSSRASSDFAGAVVHPQFWPEDLDYAGKRVVIIGSGATAVTLVPAMAGDGRARDDAPALAELHAVAARPRTRSPTRSRGCSARSGRYRVTRRKNIVVQRGDLQGVASAIRGSRARADARVRKRRAAEGLRRRHPLQPAVRPVGPAAVPGARRRPVRGDLAAAGRRSSPTASSASPERASG